MDVVVGASARESRVRLTNGTISLAEVHRYEAAAIGRKELKIKHLLRD